MAVSWPMVILPDELRSVRSTQGGKSPSFYDRRHSVLGLAFGRNPLCDARGRHGWLLAEGGGGVARIWDLDTKQIRASCESQSQRVMALSFAPDSTLLAGGGDGFNIWEAETGRIVVDRGWSGEKVSGTAFSPRSARFAAVSGRPTGNEWSCVWNLKKGRGLKRLRGLDGGIGGPSFSRDRSLVVCQTNDLRVGVWYAGTGQLLFVREPSVSRNSYNSGVDISPRGDRLKFHMGNIVELWDGHRP